ncbi:MAG TPA: hypothetical protein DDW52_21190 [Planctomycetaceae bacterium]|nr:hypothetical protein [Planctomycetaceae bacterium]
MVVCPNQIFAETEVRRLYVALLVIFVSSAKTSLSAGPPQRVERASTGDVGSPHWHTISGCPVMVEEAVDIPALESGLIVELGVKLNEPVTADQWIAKLDSRQNELQLGIAQLRHESAVRLANDKSEIDFQQLALQELQTELTKHREISSSVGDTEIRRLTLQVGKTRLSLLQARQTVENRLVEAKTRKAEIDVIQEQLRRRISKSPINGIIANLEQKVGQWVEAGETIARVENLNTLTVDAIVPLNSIDLANIVGADVRVPIQPSSNASGQGRSGTVNGQPGTVYLKGQVTSYDHKVTGRGLVRLHCAVDNILHRNQYLLLPGMNVNLEIETPTPAESRLISAGR